MKKYLCAFDYKRSVDWSDAEEMYADGPSQAAREYMIVVHTGLGHWSEDRRVWVQCPAGKKYAFWVRFNVKPDAQVRWERDLGDGD